MTDHELIAAALTAPKPARNRAVAAQPVEALLLSAPEAAALLGISVRAFHQKRATLPLPVQLGSRIVRWRRSDLARWIEGLAAAASVPIEPAQFAAARARRRGTAGPARSLDGQPAMGSKAAIAASEPGGGPQQTPVPSNP